MMSPSSWKKMITGKGNLKKDTAYLMSLNKSISKIGWATNIPTDIDDDNIADAVCMAISGYVAKRIVDGLDAPDGVVVNQSSIATLLNASSYGKRT